MKGFKTAIKMLKEDIQLEQEAAKVYRDWAKRFEEEYVKAFFKIFSRDEMGHAAGQTKFLKRLEMGEYSMKLFCPRCGWPLNFGTEPEIGARKTCPMCGAKTMLIVKEGDFLLKTV